MPTPSAGTTRAGSPPRSWPTFSASCATRRVASSGGSKATRPGGAWSAFHRLNLARQAGSEPLHGVDADRIADRFETWLEGAITLKPGAHALLDQLATRGIRLGLLTNGSTARQRGKIDRFDLARRFEAIGIEQEAGVAKPEPRA